MPEPDWAVVVTKPAAEEFAEGLIRQAGYRVYLPRFRRIIRGARIAENGRRVRSRSDGFVYRPLFQNYLFVEHVEDDRRPELETIAGVVRRLRHGAGRGDPQLLPAEFINELRRLVDAGDFDDKGLPMDKAKPLKPGDRVLIENGELRGLFATLVSMDATGRRRLLLEFFARKDVPAEVPVGIRLVLVA